MIKAILIIIMASTGYVYTAPSAPTYATMEECNAATGNADEQISKLIKEYNNSPQAKFLGKSDGTFQERCMNYTQYREMQQAIAPGNAKVIAEARAKMLGE